MSDPVELNESQLEELRQEPLWPKNWRMFAVALWSGFLGAVLILLALLMGWDALQSAEQQPAFALLAVCFAVAWVIAIIIAMVALSLATEPKPRIGPQD